jgi:hypothetical protein
VNFLFRKDTGKYRNECKTCSYNRVNNYKREILSGERQVIVKQDPETIAKIKCIKCNVEKSVDNYIKRNDSGRYRNECKDCKKIIISNYYTNTYNQKRVERRKTDTLYRLRLNHRSHINKYIFSKNQSSIRYLGCNTEMLKKWLEFNFDEEMSWDNYGTMWTIDHILPLSLFDLNNKENQNVAFSWKNLQPLKDNFSKGNKIRPWEYFNILISLHRFIQNNNLDHYEYQGINESLSWLRKRTQVW